MANKATVLENDPPAKCPEQKDPFDSEKTMTNKQTVLENDSTVKCLEQKDVVDSEKTMSFKEAILENNATAKRRKQKNAVHIKKRTTKKTILENDLPAKCLEQKNAVDVEKTMATKETILKNDTTAKCVEQKNPVDSEKTTASRTSSLEDEAKARFLEQTNVIDLILMTREEKHLRELLFETELKHFNEPLEADQLKDLDFQEFFDLCRLLKKVEHPEYKDFFFLIEISKEICVNFGIKDKHEPWLNFGCSLNQKNTKVFEMYQCKPLIYIQRKYYCDVCCENSFQVFKEFYSFVDQIFQVKALVQLRGLQLLNETMYTDFSSESQEISKYDLSDTIIFGSEKYGLIFDEKPKVRLLLWDRKEMQNMDVFEIKLFNTLYFANVRFITVRTNKKHVKDIDVAEENVDNTLFIQFLNRWASGIFASFGEIDIRQDIPTDPKYALAELNRDAKIIYCDRKSEVLGSAKISFPNQSSCLITYNESGFVATCSL